MTLSPELEDRIKSKKLDLENLPAEILEDKTTSFYIASYCNNKDLIFKLLELTQDSTERSQMIHAGGDASFIMASLSDKTEIVNILLGLTPNDPERSRMIHAGTQATTIYHPVNNLTFRLSAQYGHADIINKQLDLTPNDPERSQRIHAYNDAAFKLAAINGHAQIINILLDSTLNDPERSQMIHADNDHAFISAAKNGHLQIINTLLDATQNDPGRLQMIHSGEYTGFFSNNIPFTMAAKHGHTEIINKLLEVTPNDPERSHMISTSFLTPLIKCDKKVQELITLIHEEKIPGFQELNPERMTKLSELRSDLITNLSGKMHQSPEQKIETINKANYVMAKLLNKDNLQEAKDLLQNKDLLGKGKASIPMPEALQDIVVNYLSIPTESLKFSSLENPDAAIALDTIKDFFHKKPRTKVLGTREENEKVERLKMTEENHNI